MSALEGILADLREKRLWALAAALLVALIAVPLLLSSGSGAPASAVSGSPGATSPAMGVTGASGSSGAPGVSSGAPGVSSGAPGVSSGSAGALSAGSSPSASLQQVSVSALGGAKRSGPPRDPFAQQGSGPKAQSAAAVAAPTAVVGSAAAPSGSAGTGSASGSASGSATGSATRSARGAGSSSQAGRSSSGASRRGRGTSKAGPRATQSYRVSLAIASPTGQFSTTNSLTRLSVLSSGTAALAVELGVLRGGRRVLFAVLPGTLVHGPGRCIPGGADCEIISLAPGQVEDLGERTVAGAVLVGRFAVTAIAVDTHASAAAAARARRAASATGRRLLAEARLPALALFAYQPSTGTLRDLRDLVVREG